MILQEVGSFCGKEEVVLEKLVLEWLPQLVLCGRSLLVHLLELSVVLQSAVSSVLAKNSLAPVVSCAFAGVLVQRLHLYSQIEPRQLCVSGVKAIFSVVSLYHSGFAWGDCNSPDFSVSFSS